MEVVAARTLNALYVYLDVAWLVIFGAILLWQRKRTAFVAGLAPLVINSLIETNLGMPYLYLIHEAVSRRHPGAPGLVGVPSG